MKSANSMFISIFLLTTFSLLSCSKDNLITEPRTDITEDEHIIKASKKIGPKGGEIDFGDGTVLSIPENALSGDVEISISKLKNVSSSFNYGIETFSLEPSGIKLNKSLMLQIKYKEYQDFGEELISAITYNQNLGIWERLKIIEQDQNQNTIRVEIEHFTWYRLNFDRPLDLVIEIPGKYLKKSDIIFTLTCDENKFTWNPGHVGLFLGTTDAKSQNNDEKTTIESSPWKSTRNRPDGVQFNTLEDFIHPDPWFTHHLYMGARRYDGSMTDDDRIKIAEFAINKKDDGYYNVSDWWGTNLLWGKGQYNQPSDNSCYCSGLVEGAYDNAGLSIVEDVLEYPGITPLEQFIRTLPVDEIVVKSNVELKIPVKGVVWVETTKEHTDNRSKYDLWASSIPPGASFSNDTLIWTPDESNVGNTYTAKFFVSAIVNNKSYNRYQHLKINVVKNSINPDGLVAYYPFNNNANNESGIGNNGTVYGAALTTDRKNNPNSAYYFDGTNDYIKVEDAASLRLSDAATIAMWLNIDTGTDYQNVYDFRHMICKGATYGGYYEDYSIGLSNPLGALQWGYGMVKTDNPLPQGSWHHIAVSFDYNQQKIKLYVDGNLKKTYSEQFPKLTVSNRALYIGARYSSSVKTYFKGKLDDILIYNRVLSQDEIRLLYEN